MDQLLFSFINFFIFCGILFYVLKNPAKTMFENRSLDIEKAIEGAKRAHDIANQKLEEAKSKLSRFEKEKEMLMREAEEDIQRFNQKSLKELEILLERIKLDNGQRIQEELKKTTEELKLVFAKEIVASAEKILKEKLADSEAPFIETYVDDLKKGASWQKESPSAMPEHS